MKKLFVPIAVLMAFSVLTTSASAEMPYVIRFHGSAYGHCRVASGDLYHGTGRIHVSGLAIGEEEGSYYSDIILKVRAHMRVIWEDGYVMVHMWPPGEAQFNDEYDIFEMELHYSGYLYEEGYGMMQISGFAHMTFEPGDAEVLLEDSMHNPFFVVEWHHVWTHVTAWPLEYPT